MIRVDNPFRILWCAYPMNAEKAEPRRIARHMAELSTRRARVRHIALMLLAVAGGMHHQAVAAQDAQLLDSRVTQQSVGETICRPGYADAVAPPFDESMALKDKLLAQRGIDADEGAQYALDRRVPIVLGGSPDAVANYDLLQWGGHGGERRKALLTVRLKRCVCAGQMSLADAQAAILGDWVSEYERLTRMACGASTSADLTAASDDGR
jgi:hypothetical protein